MLFPFLFNISMFQWGNAQHYSLLFPIPCMARDWWKVYQHNCNTLDHKWDPCPSWWKATFYFITCFSEHMCVWCVCVKPELSEYALLSTCEVMWQCVSVSEAAYLTFHLPAQAHIDWKQNWRPVNCGHAHTPLSCAAPEANAYLLGYSLATYPHTHPYRCSLVSLLLIQ